MKNFIIHISKYIHRIRNQGHFVNKRIEIKAPEIMVAYNKAIELNPGFVVNMIWPEWK